MSGDPETERQIAELSLDTRPLLVLDVDDVVLEFLPPFMRFLNAQELELKLESFRLHGNVRRLGSGEVVENDHVTQLITDFFDAQGQWQRPTAGAAEAIAGMADSVEIVLLSAMPHRHREIRRRNLDAHGFPYPLLTTEKAKGPALKQLRGESGRPVAFVDDIPHNLVSARSAIADASLFHLIVTPGLRALLPPLPETIVPVDSWAEATPQIRTALGI
jgi:hypothetical protein